MPTQAPIPAAYRVLARSLLARAPGFEQCPQALLDELLAAGELLQASPGTVLLRRGDLAPHLLLVIEGVIGARISVADHSQLLAIILPGMVMGYVPMVDGGPISHDLVARSAVIALALPMAATRALFQRRELGQALQWQLSQRLRRVYDTVLYTKTFSLRERLLMQIVSLADRLGLKRGKGVAIDLPLSQADLADLIGAGRQTVNLELRRLADQGLLRPARERLEVLDLETLRAQLPVGMPALELHLV